MSDIRFNQWLHNSGTGGVSQVDGGHVGIGTTNPLIPVGSGNTAILNVGVVTANSFYGDGSNLSGVQVGGASSLSFNDNIGAYFGNSQDLKIYHDGNHSYIDDQGTGNLRLRSGTLEILNLAGNKTSATFSSGGGQTLNFNNSAKFATTNTGVVVTGIVTSTSRLSVGNNTTNAVDLEFGTNRGSAGQTLANINWKWNNTYVAQIRGMAGSDTTNKDDAHLTFYTAAAGSLSERLRITSGGDMGLGTDSPASAHDRVLTIAGTNSAELKLTGSNYGVTDTDGADVLFSYGGLYLINNESTGNIHFHTGSGVPERLRITSAGKIGIGGETSPEFKVTVYDAGYSGVTLKTNRNTATDNIGGLHFKTQSTNVAYIQSLVDGTIKFRNSSSLTERLRITSGGYLKLGSTDGGGWHTIRLNTTTNNAIKDVLNIHSSVDGATAAAGFGVRLNFFGEQLNGNEYIYGSIAGLLSSSGSGYGDLAFYTNNNGTNTERLRIDSGGKLWVDRTHASATTGNHPAIDIDTYANGTAGATFATGIDFRVAGVHKKRMVVTNGSGTGGGDWIFYRDQGNNEALRITSSGYIQTNNNPSFRAGLNANTTFNQSTDIIFNDTSATWHYNRGGHYNTSNGRFTAPVTGVYQFNACVIWYGAQNNTFMGDAFHFYVNGGNAAYSGRRAWYNTGTTGNSLYYTDHMSVNLYLNATDYVHIRQSSSVVTVHGNTYYTWFAGSFLG